MEADSNGEQRNLRESEHCQNELIEKIPEYSPTETFTNFSSEFLETGAGSSCGSNINIPMTNQENLNKNLTTSPEGCTTMEALLDQSPPDNNSPNLELAMPSLMDPLTTHTPQSHNSITEDHLSVPAELNEPDLSVNGNVNAGLLTDILSGVHTPNLLEFDYGLTPSNVNSPFMASQPFFPPREDLGPDLSREINSSFPNQARQSLAQSPQSVYSDPLLGGSENTVPQTNLTPFDTIQSHQPSTMANSGEMIGQIGEVPLFSRGPDLSWINEVLFNNDASQTELQDNQNLFNNAQSQSAFQNELQMFQQMHTINHNSGVSPNYQPGEHVANINNGVQGAPSHNSGVFPDQQFGQNVAHNSNIFHINNLHTVVLEAGSPWINLQQQTQAAQQQQLLQQPWLRGNSNASNAPVTPSRPSVNQLIGLSTAYDEQYTNLRPQASVNQALLTTSNANPQQHYSMQSAGPSIHPWPQQFQQQLNQASSAPQGNQPYTYYYKTPTAFGAQNLQYYNFAFPNRHMSSRLRIQPLQNTTSPLNNPVEARIPNTFEQPSFYSRQSGMAPNTPNSRRSNSIPSQTSMPSRGGISSGGEQVKEDIIILDDDQPQQNNNSMLLNSSSSREMGGTPGLNSARITSPHLNNMINNRVAAIDPLAEIEAQRNTLRLGQRGRGRRRTRFEFGEASSTREKRPMTTTPENPPVGQSIPGQFPDWPTFASDQNQGASNASGVRVIKNSLYDPVYETMGLPIDPHIRLFNIWKAREANNENPNLNLNAANVVNLDSCNDEDNENSNSESSNNPH